MNVICTIPKKNVKKFEYVIHVVFKEILGISYLIINSDNARNIEITYKDRKKKLIINNVFLDKNIDNFSNLNMPENTLHYVRCYLSNYNAPLTNIPVLFGGSDINETSNEVYIGCDVFGCIFFLLSRYEELIVTDRDKHNRFSAKSSVLYKFGLLERPIVDELVELLWYFMVSLWPDLKKPDRIFNTYISCDVDQPFDTTVENYLTLMSTCFNDIFKRRSILEAANRVRRYYHKRIGDYRLDPFFTFDWYMDVCERENIKAAFYFIPTSIEPFNGSYELNDPRIESLLLRINSRGHEIGVHGSYQSYNDSNKLCTQKKILEDRLDRLGIDQMIKGNRQHYLRWSTDITPDLLDNAGFIYDTTGGFADHVGFKYGTTHEFSMWSWQKQRRLNLKQRPLIIMESTLLDKIYMGLGFGKDFLEYVIRFHKLSEYYGGSFTLLWHNSSLKNKKEKHFFLKTMSLLSRHI